MTTLLIMLVFGAIYGIISGMYDLPFWGLYIVLFIFTAALIGDLFYTIFKSQNLVKIRKFLMKYKKEPVYQYMLLHEQNAPDEDKIDTLRQVLAKHKQDKYQATYGVHLALVNEDFEAAKQAIRPLLNTDIGEYTNEIIHILSGDHYSNKRQYKKQWMNDSVLAHEAFMRNDLSAFDSYSSKSLEQTGGVQYFGNYYSFRDMRSRIQQKTNA